MSNYVAVDKIMNIPPYDPRSGNHYYVVCAAYAMDPSIYKHGERHVLDHETLVMVDGPVCWYCNAPYDRRYPIRRCTGKPHWRHQDPFEPTPGGPR
jgi:hypothetical protein